MQCNAIYKNAAGWSLVEVGVSTIEGRSVNDYLMTLDYWWRHSIHWNYIMEEDQP